MSHKLDKHAEAYTDNTQYDFDNEVMLKWYSERIVALTQDASSLLELGLGHGYTTNIFSQNIQRHVVLEGSSAVIENYKHKFPNCRSEMIETLFETYNTTECFDVIVLGFILEHVDDPAAILRQYKNYLSPNGQIFVSVPNAEVMNRRLGHLAGMLPNMKTLSEYDLLLGHQRYYTAETLTKELTDSGYEIVHMEGIYLKPFTSSQMSSLKLEPSVYSALCHMGVNYPELSCGLLAQARIL